MDLMNDHRKKIRKLQGDLKANNVKLEEKDLLNKQYKVIECASIMLISLWQLFNHMRAGM
jgi:hypothetical protein